MWARGLTKTQRSECEKKLDDYWRDAKRYVKAHTDDPRDPPWFAFEDGSKARWKWEMYFAERLGFMPVGLDYQRMGKIHEFLVPCELPEEFDPNYKPKVTWIEETQDRDGA